MGGLCLRRSGPLFGSAKANEGETLILDRAGRAS